MKNRKLITMLGSVALVAALGVGATLAYFTDNATAKNVITMGHVDIYLEEPNFPTNKTIKDVVPNQVITKDPTIVVEDGSESCYLRAKVDFTGLTDEQIADIIPNITFRQDWVQSEDGYYYYQHMINKDEDEERGYVLFDSVRIPETWGNEVAETSFNINVTAEAIQANYFTPEIVDGVIVGWNDVKAEPYLDEKSEEQEPEVPSEN